MISLQKTGNAIKFTFDDNGHYLYNGTIEVPVNSLTLVTDDSDMFTFKKSATNDIFVSGLYSEIGMSKSELETFYKNNMVDSFINADEAQSMIDESISGKVNTVDNQVDAYGIETSSGETARRDYVFSADSYANGAFYYKSEEVLQDGYNRISGGIKIVDSSDNIVLDYTVPDGQATNIWNPSEYSQYFTVTEKNRYSATIEPSGDYRILSCNINVNGEAIRNTAKYYITTAKYPSYQSAEAIENNVYPKLEELEARIKALEEQNNT
ncbi:hypothetical protein [uncultured Methanobrevibacter sp.]|uniref:hypothetical protein n=1 Tax=uncultured Methanobrevibacter sp. TaxID=253161 RepID=UPI0025EC181C|nr:hypothetical protein [uncultured Methanobrevibacter sp.]